MIPPVCSAANVPTKAWRTGAHLALAGLLAVATFVFACAGGKVIPGSPSISLLHDVAPFLTGLLAIGNGFVCLRSGGAVVRIVAMLFLLAATVGIGIVMVNVYTFWADTYARGDLIGW
jgi:hypothetical protein